MTDIDDLFFSRDIRADLIDMLIWQMLQRVIYEKSSSCISAKFLTVEIISKINASEHILKKITLLKWKILTSVKARWQKVWKTKSVNMNVKQNISSVDALKNDSEKDETSDWEAEILDSQKKLKLSVTLKKINLSDSWWQREFILKALKVVKTDSFSFVSFDSTDVDEFTIYSDLHNKNLQSFIWTNELKVSQMSSREQLTSNIIKSSKKALKTFRKQQKWLNNQIYQQENHVKACKNLEIVNFKMSKIPEMRKSISLKFWQSVIIDAMMKFAEQTYLHDEILSDVIDLEKTWMIIDFFLIVDLTLNNLILLKTSSESIFLLILIFWLIIWLKTSSKSLSLLTFI